MPINIIKIGPTKKKVHMGKQFCIKIRPFWVIFSKFQNMVLFWLLMGVFRLKNRVDIENRLPDPFFIKRVKKGKKGTIY